MFFQVGNHGNRLDWSSMPAELLDLIGSHRSRDDVYRCLQVCRHWHLALINSRDIWTTFSQQLGFITCQGDLEHPQDKCRRLVTVLRNFIDHVVTVTDVKLEKLTRDAGEEIKWIDEDVTSSDGKEGSTDSGNESSTVS